MEKSTNMPDITRHKFLSYGNSKLPKNCAIFNLLAVMDCPNCETCKDTCYALFRQGTDNVRKHREVNSWFARNRIDLLYTHICNELMKKKDKVKYLRIHESGDFISTEYLIMWYLLALRFPDIIFFSMTKVKKALEIANTIKLKNLNIMESMPDGLRNYGSKEYCAKLCKEHGCYKCPDVDHDNVCLVKCKYCTKGKRPCFEIHGNLKGKDTYEK